MLKQISVYIRAYALPTLWAGVIFILSSQTVLAGLDVSVFDFVFKKLAHMFVFAVLYALLHRAATMTISPEKKWLKFLVPLLICLAYTFSDEFHQSMVPGRFATLRDVGYDTLGMSIAILRIYRYI